MLDKNVLDIKNHKFTEQERFCRQKNTYFFEKNFMAPYYGSGSTASRWHLLCIGSLFFVTEFPDISGNNFTNSRRMEGWVKLGATQWFWTCMGPLDWESSALTTKPYDGEWNKAPWWRDLFLQNNNFVMFV